MVNDDMTTDVESSIKKEMDLDLNEENNIHDQLGNPEFITSDVFESSTQCSNLKVNILY